MFWLASRTSRQIPLFTFTSHLHLWPTYTFNLHLLLPAIDAEPRLSLLRREIAVAVCVTAEGDLQIVARREVARELQPVMPRVLLQRGKDEIRTRLRVDEVAWRRLDDLHGGRNRQCTCENARRGDEQ